ncbi:MAG: hypothetical protein WC742_14600 [Gallionellaceae bacterium]
MLPPHLKNMMIGVALGFVLGVVCEVIYAKTQSGLLVFGALLVGAFIFGDEKTNGWRILPYMLGAAMGGGFVIALGRTFNLPFQPF